MISHISYFDRKGYFLMIEYLRYPMCLLYYPNERFHEGSRKNCLHFHIHVQTRNLLYMLNYLNFYPCMSHYNACIHIHFPSMLHKHCSAATSWTWDATCLERLSFRLHHFPRSISQHVPDISLLLQTGVSQPDLHTAPTTQTPSGTTTPHTSSIFHSRMKYAWMCARHLPSLGLCSPQEARLICNWEVCWINQQFIRFLIEITLSKTLITRRTAPLILPYCLLPIVNAHWWPTEIQRKITMVTGKS